jgi:putative ABC transport system permease protein
MVRLESVLISLLGAALGACLGLVCGVALQRSQASFGIRVPAALVGVVAAAWPARRAVRVDVLRAITTG